MPCRPALSRHARPSRRWLHETKHNGIRVVARKDGERVRPYSRPGNCLTDPSSLIVDAVARLRARF
jgi:ATP-dependent DNA ligase